MTIECDEEGCQNAAVWRIPHVNGRTQALCNKHYWQDKCSCRPGYDNPKCSVHGREVSIEQGIDPDWEQAALTDCDRCGSGSGIMGLCANCLVEAGSVGPDPRDSSIDVVRLSHE